jgi:hypothetical protein
VVGDDIPHHAPLLRVLGHFGLAFVMVLVPLVVPMLTREADYSVFNTGWNGCSDFYKDYISTYGAESVATTEDIYLNAVLRDLTHLDTDPRDAMLLIIGPSKPYGTHELAYLRTFLSEGGRVILADDFGVGNDILSFLGIDARFSASRSSTLRTRPPARAGHLLRVGGSTLRTRRFSTTPPR